jgi:hypothetical protein
MRIAGTFPGSPSGRCIPNITALNGLNRLAGWPCMSVTMQVAAGLIRKARV